jgi:hypothetical protein
MTTWLGKATLLTVCLGALGSSAAQIYRHMDEHGVVHFSHAPVAQDSEIVDQDDLDALMTIVPRTELLDATPQRAAEKARVQTRASRTAAHRRAQKVRDGDAARCDGYRSRIDRVQSRLRAGYRIDEGNRLRAERRQLMSLMGRECKGR